MKNKITILFLLSALTAFGQKTDKIIASVYYTFKHMPDTLQKDFFRTENMVLYVGKDLNKYISRDKEIKDSIRIKQIESGGGTVINTAGQKTTATEIYIDKNQRQMIVSESLIKRYFYEDAFPLINWKIMNEVKDFENLKCTKAVGEFKGRIYTAWFTTDLPISGAPWKLCGLPGLIIEAYDNKKEVFFQLSAIGKQSDSNSIISPPQNAIKTNKKDYFMMLDAAKNDPVAFINASAAEAGSGLKISPGSSGGNFKPKKQSNPIELKDN